MILIRNIAKINLTSLTKDLCTLISGVHISLFHTNNPLNKICRFVNVKMYIICNLSTYNIGVCHCDELLIVRAKVVLTGKCKVF